VIAGANLDYAPVDLSGKANQFRTEAGWFGDAKCSFKEMAAGDQTMAGVRFNVYEFPTSPVPTVVMLAGQGVPYNCPDQVTDVPVKQKADALFFLQAARVDKPVTDAERKANKQAELARYVIHYADGQTAEVPLLLDVNIASYRQKEPASPLPEAQVGWSKAFAGTQESGVAYVMQWNNPRPDAEIASIDLVYGKGAERRGVPALIAVTAAKVVR
jgi:hypothetical protein